LKKNRANRNKILLEVNSIGEPPIQPNKKEKDSVFRKRVLDWSKRHKEIREKYKIELKSEYDQNMVIDTDVGYEVEELELEEA